MKLANSDHAHGILQALAAAALFGVSTPLAETLIDSTLELHATPFGTTQPFLYALFQRTSAADGAINKV